MENPVVIKIGGNELEDSVFVEEFAKAIVSYHQKHSCIIVHGGGRAINEMLQALHIEPKYVDGQRVTDEATLEVVEMVLSGLINKRLVTALLNLNVDAIGISGVDRKLLVAEPWGDNMDLVGRIVQVRTEIFEGYFRQNVIAVVSPLSIGNGGRYNVNADHAAGMIAGAIQAQATYFISNVPGVLNNGQIIPALTKVEVEELIEKDIINGGMIPKVNAAIDALENGSQQAIITNLDGFINGIGTTFTTRKETA